MHKDEVTQVIQNRGDLSVIVTRGSQGWRWWVKEQTTGHILDGSRGVYLIQDQAMYMATQALTRVLQQRAERLTRIVSIGPYLAVGSVEARPLVPEDVPLVHTLNDLEQRIEHELARVRRDSNHQFAPYRRMLLYAALGPTYSFPTEVDRTAQIKAGTLLLTRADRVRTRLALLTATHVLPIWDTELAGSRLATSAQIEREIQYMLRVIMELDLPTVMSPALSVLLTMKSMDYTQFQTLVNSAAHELTDSQRAILHELIADGIRAHQMGSSTCLRLPLNLNLLTERLIGKGSYLAVTNAEIPQYTCALANALLQGDLDSAAGLQQSALIAEGLGTFLGWDEEEVPDRALDCATAALEALYQALGYSPFRRNTINPTTTEEFVSGQGVAAAAAVRADSGIFEGLAATDTFDPERQLRFWTWWLTEALPSAWRAERETFDDITYNG